MKYQMAAGLGSPDRGREVIADEGTHIGFAVDVDHHHIAQLQRIDHPGVLTTDPPLFLAVFGDEVGEIGSARHELGGDRAADQDPIRVGHEPIAEKLLIYALGRGLEYYDMPTVRRIVKDSAGRDDRFSSLILGIVKSTPFQMRSAAPSATVAQQ